jgi:hypothetical protein
VIRKLFFPNLIQCIKGSGFVEGLGGKDCLSILLLFFLSIFRIVLLRRFI